MRANMAAAALSHLGFIGSGRALTRLQQLSASVSAMTVALSTMSRTPHPFVWLMREVEDARPYENAKFFKRPIRSMFSGRRCRVHDELRLGVKSPRSIAAATVVTNGRIAVGHRRAHLEEFANLIGEALAGPPYALPSGR